MPLYHTNQGLLYFAHVPKCAGTSLNEYLEARFGEPAFQDRGHIRNAAPVSWTRTSPQHIDRDSLDRVLPRGFFQHSVAVVRNPISRLVSVFHFQRERQKRIPRWRSFDSWLAGLEKARRKDPYILDNHPRPQVDFLPDDTKWFRIEDGLDHFTDHLDNIVGAPAEEIVIGHAKKADKARKVEPSERARDLIFSLYRADFDRFGYAP